MVRKDTNRTEAKAFIPDHFDKEELVHLIEGMVRKYSKQHEHLKAARQKLVRMREKVTKMKGIIEYQRQRIIQLYESKS